jgi:hypothetical protein
MLPCIFAVPASLAITTGCKFVQDRFCSTVNVFVPVATDIDVLEVVA